VFLLARPPDSILKTPTRLSGSLQIENPVFLALKVVVVHEEFFQFLDEFLTEFLHMPHVRITVIGFFDGDYAVVSLALRALQAFSFLSTAFGRCVMPDARIRIKPGSEYALE